jgi:uncharacterized lipoprotein NlpE involved in copper resistance
VIAAFFYSGKTAKESYVKKFKVSLAMLALVLAVGLALVGCDNGTNSGGEERSPVIYSGVSGNAIYTLTISPPRNLAALADDDYVLVVNRSTSTKTSVGKVIEVANDTFVLQPSVADAPTFSVTTSSASITAIANSITYTDGASEAASGAFGSGSDGGISLDYYSLTFTINGRSAGPLSDDISYFQLTINGKSIAVQSVGSRIVGDNLQIIVDFVGETEKLGGGYYAVRVRYICSKVTPFTREGICYLK